MNDYKWCMSCIASANDVVELQVKIGQKWLGKPLCRSLCIQS